MGRAHKILTSVLRGLNSPMAKKIVSWGFEKLAPSVGELVLTGTDFMRQHGLGDLAEKITDKALKAVSDAPNTITELTELGEMLVGEGGASHEKRERRKSMDREETPRRRVRSSREPEGPYNDEPNATYPNPAMAYYGPGVFPGQPYDIREGSHGGSGRLLYGNDIPRPPRLQQAPTPKERLVHYAPHPSGQNAFGDIGYPPRSQSMPPPRYSVAGPEFRPVGPGTNIYNYVPNAYGEPTPQPLGLPPYPGERPRRQRKPKKKEAPPSEKAKRPEKAKRSGKAKRK